MTWNYIRLSMYGWWEYVAMWDCIIGVEKTDTIKIFKLIKIMRKINVFILLSFLKSIIIILSQEIAKTEWLTHGKQNFLNKDIFLQLSQERHICNNMRGFYNINMSLSGSKNGVCVAGTILDYNCPNGSLILKISKQTLTNSP